MGADKGGIIEDQKDFIFHFRQYNHRDTIYWGNRADDTNNFLAHRQWFLFSPS